MLWGTQKKANLGNPQPDVARLDLQQKGSGLGVGVAQGPKVRPAGTTAPRPGEQPQVPFGQGRGPKPSQHFTPQDLGQPPPPPPQPTLGEQDKGELTQKDLAMITPPAPASGGYVLPEPTYYGSGWLDPAKAQAGQAQTESQLEAMMNQWANQPPQLSKEYAQAGIDELKAQQAKDLQALQEATNAAGTGASGAYGSQYEGLTTAGSLAQQQYKADIEAKNIEMKQDWYKMSTDAFLKKWGAELDAATKQAIAGGELGQGQEKILLEAEAQKAELAQNFADSAQGQFYSALQGFEGDWNEHDKASYDGGAAAIQMALADGTLDYATATAILTAMAGAWKSALTATEGDPYNAIKELLEEYGLGDYFAKASKGQSPEITQYQGGEGGPEIFDVPEL